MKFGKMAKAFFSLFLLFYGQVYALTSSDVKRAIKHAIYHPVDSAINCCSMGVKGFLCIYPGKEAFRKAYNFFEQSRADEDSWSLLEKRKGILKTGVVVLGLGMLAFKSGSSLLNDIKKLQ